MINGFVCLLGNRNVSKYLEDALKTMKYRAKNGYLIKTDKDSYLLKNNFVDIEESRNILTGYCLSGNQYIEDMPIHGRIFEDTNPLKSFNRIEDPKDLANKLKGIEGYYSFVFQNKDNVIFGRDPLGLKPLFFGKNKNLIGLASDGNSLKKIGLNVINVDPGFVYKADLDNIERFSIYRLSGKINRNMKFDAAAETILNLINSSLTKRIGGKKIMIAFSGGIDSSLLTYLSLRISKIKLVSVYAKDSKDEKNAKSASDLLGLELIEKALDFRIIKNSIDNIVKIIGKSNPMQISIGLAVNTAALTAYEEGCDGLILGQLADELFGGYFKYEQAFNEKGPLSAHSMMVKDVRDAHKDNFERDEACCSPYTDIILPYTSNALVNFALSIPPQFKLNKYEKKRKIILRYVSKIAGVPIDIILRPKSALQYSSGLEKSVYRLMKIWY